LSDFLRSFKNGALFAGSYGAVGALVFAGVTALVGGPVLTVAAIGAGLFGLFGSAMSAVNDGTNGAGGDYRGSWASGLPTTALMVAGILAFGADRPAPDTKPVPSPTSLTQSFKVATADSVASCVPAGSYPRSNVASKGPVAPGG
jgi:hypothetical protein